MIFLLKINYKRYTKNIIFWNKLLFIIMNIINSFFLFLFFLFLFFFPSLSFSLSQFLSFDLSFLSMLSIRNSWRPRSCKIERWKAIASRLPPSRRWHFERPSSESKLQERTLSSDITVSSYLILQSIVISRRYTYVFEVEFQIWPYFRHAELLVDREKEIST